MAGEWADERGIEHLQFLVDSAGLGQKAGPIRKLQVLFEGKPDLLIASRVGRSLRIRCSEHVPPA